MDNKYFGLLILGYFVIKIFYGLIKILPDKETNEMFDFITMIVMSIVLFVFTNISLDNIFIFIGFVVGLNLPLLFTKFNLNFIHGIDYVYFSLFLFVIISILLINFLSGNPMFYILYIISLIFIVGGTIYTRKISKLYSTAKYNNDTKKLDNGIISFPGTDLNLSYAFIGWIIAMIFIYKPSSKILNIVFSLFNGVFIGIFVGATSLFGFPYILNNNNSYNYLSNINVQNQNTYDNIKINTVDDINKILEKEYINIHPTLSTIKWMNAFMIFSLIALLLAFYISSIKNINNTS